MKQAHCWIVLLGALALSACGGGGGGGSASGSAGGGGSGGSGGGGSGTTATYTIGGTVQGVAMYSSSGMVLQDNGGNDLPVSSDGPFTFSEPVNSGAAYKVTVETQPTGETCTVTGGQSTASANVSNIAVNCNSSFVSASNMASVSVGTFPSDVTLQTFNVPIVTVAVCNAGGTCNNIQVVVDTGSSGLRLMASAVAGLNLPAEASGSGNLFECAYYADGYAWGGVYTAAQVKVGGETASAVPIQVIEAGSGNTPPADVPTHCSNNAPPGTTDLDSPDDFSADGVLGVGPAAQDCGSACTSSAIYYYSCPAGGCTAGAAAVTVATVSDEVTNPVTLFATDNTGIVLQLPAISASGVASTTGYLGFGVATQADNGIGAATIVPLNPSQPQNQQPMYLTTSFDGISDDGIIDSGSNALFFSDSTLQATLCGTTAPLNQFYCPASAVSLTATNSGGSAMSTVSFEVANFNTLAASMFYAYNDIGGSAPSVNGTTYFDWGVPFFYGRTVYTIIDGATVGGQTYANGAFAY